jgi:hypothetical protein
MQIANYIQSKFLKIKNKISNLSEGHNNPVKISVDIKCVHLVEKDDNLVEIEVRSGERMGWIYDDDVEFLSYQFIDGHWILLNFRAVRSLVEEIAKSNGKKYCDKPTKHHIRKADNGIVYYYITTEDLKSLHQIGL